MRVFTVSFFGHRCIGNLLPIETKLEALVRELLRTKEFVVFPVGRNGEFDQLVSSAVRRSKRDVRDDNSALVLVLPYLTAEFKKNEQSFRAYYDEIEICEESACAHFKAAHQVRNRQMVSRADLTVFCVKHPYGGAYETMRYAKENRVNYINLAET